MFCEDLRFCSFFFSFEGFTSFNSDQSTISKSLIFSRKYAPIQMAWMKWGPLVSIRRVLPLLTHPPWFPITLRSYPNKTGSLCQLDGMLRRERHGVRLLLAVRDSGPALASCFRQDSFRTPPSLPLSSPDSSPTRTVALLSSVPPPFPSISIHFASPVCCTPCPILLLPDPLGWQIPSS